LILEVKCKIIFCLSESISCMLLRPEGVEKGGQPVHKHIKKNKGTIVVTHRTISTYG